MDHSYDRRATDRRTVFTIDVPTGLAIAVLGLIFAPVAMAFYWAALDRKLPQEIVRYEIVNPVVRPGDRLYAEAEIVTKRKDCELIVEAFIHDTQIYRLRTRIHRSLSASGTLRASKRLPKLPPGEYTYVTNRTFKSNPMHEWFPIRAPDQIATFKVVE